MKHYQPTKPTKTQAINEKMKVLREFYIVNDTNEDTIKQKLTDAVNAHSDKDYERILDQIARTMISEKL